MFAETAETSVVVLSMGLKISLANGTSRVFAFLVDGPPAAPCSSSMALRYTSLFRGLTGLLISSGVTLPLRRGVKRLRSLRSVSLEHWMMLRPELALRAKRRNAKMMPEPNRVSSAKRAEVCLSSKVLRAVWMNTGSRKDYCGVRMLQCQVWGRGSCLPA